MHYTFELTHRSFVRSWVLSGGFWVSHWFWNSDQRRKKMCCKCNLKCLEVHVHWICIKKREAEKLNQASQQHSLPSLPPSYIPFRLHATFNILRLHWLFINLILPEKCSGEGVDKRKKYSGIPQGFNILWEWPSFKNFLPDMSNFFKPLLNSILY